MRTVPYENHASSVAKEAEKQEVKPALMIREIKIRSSIYK
jgi:hypothetical protein